MLKKIIAVLLFALLAANASTQNPIHRIEGTARLDQNADCIADPGDTPLENWFLRIETGAGKSFSVETDDSGYYQFFVPDGMYEVRLLPLNGTFEICANASQSVSFTSGTPQSATFDFVAKAAFNCPRLRSELSATGVQPCSTAIIRAFYRNDGSTAAQNTRLAVTLDRLLTFQSATPMPTSIMGKELVFDLGSLPPKPGGTWNSVEIRAKVSCNANPGAQVGANAEITPNNFCSSASNWSGAIVVASGFCVSNFQAEFYLSNIGTAPTETLEFTIIEDQIVLREGTFQLDPGEVEPIDTVEANGLPITIIAQQEPGFPGDSLVFFTVYNCNGEGEKGIGLGGSPGPSHHQVGFQVIDYQEKNEKSALPPGYGPDHRLARETPIEYRLAFQNETNQIVSNLVLRDTLDPRLDFDKIEPRGSSHAFGFAKIADSVVQFTFMNLQLPPAATNPEGSKGFVEFLVYPKKYLPPGTEVFNRAGYFFDQNPVVLTNTVGRVYDSVLLVKIIDLQGFGRTPVKVWPNPFTVETNFELPDNISPGGQLEVYDATGRLIRRIYFSEKTCLLRREGLPGGILFWKLRTADGSVASGKIIAEE